MALSHLYVQSQFMNEKTVHRADINQIGGDRPCNKIGDYCRLLRILRSIVSLAICITISILWFQIASFFSHGFFGLFGMLPLKFWPPQWNLNNDEVEEHSKENKNIQQKCTRKFFYFEIRRFKVIKMILISMLL